MVILLYTLVTLLVYVILIKIMIISTIDICTFLRYVPPRAFLSECSVWERLALKQCPFVFKSIYKYIQIAILLLYINLP
jgi:hypothetical protein